MYKRMELLKKIFFFLLALVLLFIFLTPHLARKGFYTIQNEHNAQAILITALFIIGLIIYRFYKKEVDKGKAKMERLRRERMTLEERLNEAFKYIGAINVQIEEIRSAFSDVKKYPENKQDLKYVLDFFANKILGIINVDWTVLRIVNLTDYKTLVEYTACRGENGRAEKCDLANRGIMVDGDEDPKFDYLKSEEKNLTLRVVCIYPKKKLNKDQETFIKAIANQMELLFIFFTSNYYKDSRMGA